MLSKTNKRQSGFTIIEVLIVLAIAGLIMLIVFLAVPALQRNARNSQRNRDVSALLGGMSEFVNNNNGSLPTGGTFSAGTTATIGTSGTNTVPVSLSYYDGSKISIVDGSSAAISNPNSTDQVIIVTGATCGASGASAVGSGRAYVALYMLENNAKQCKSS